MPCEIVRDNATDFAFLDAGQQPRPGELAQPVRRKKAIRQTETVDNTSLRDHSEPGLTGGSELRSCGFKSRPRHHKKYRAVILTGYSLFFLPYAILGSISALPAVVSLKILTPLCQKL